MNSLRDLTKFKEVRTRRISSYDKTGGNLDFIRIPRDRKVTLANIKGAGCITHIWFTINCRDNDYLRKILLRMYWDGEKDPSVDTPLGDFFGIGHGVAKSFQSLPLNIVGGTGMKGDRAAFNCYWPMPFSKSAKVEVVNECYCMIDNFYYHIDYEEYKQPDEDALMFHAKWRRENPCDGEKLAGENVFEAFIKPKNLSGEGNYVILEAEGKGHYAGCILNVDNLEIGDKALKFGKTPFEWWGEGDDMIFIDGEKWPPSLHGTGTEDYFLHAWGMQKDSFLYAGTSLYEFDPDFKNRRKCTAYRFHIDDPVRFKKSIKVTIEHGHANTQSNDYSSVAYWYQTEPHRPWALMPKADERLPRPDPYDSQTVEEKKLEKEVNQKIDEVTTILWSDLEKEKKLTEQHQQIFSSSFLILQALKEKDYKKAKNIAEKALEEAKKLNLKT